MLSSLVFYSPICPKRNKTLGKYKSPTCLTDKSLKQSHITKSIPSIACCLYFLFKHSSTSFLNLPGFSSRLGLHSHPASLIIPICNPCRTNPCPTTCTTKRKLSGSECQPPPKVPKTIDTKLSDCYIVDQPQNQFVRQAFFFNPLDDAAQQMCCNLLRLNYHNKNIVSAGGPHIPLTAPDRSTLVDTVGDGSCMFRAMSVIITGNQRLHKAVRRAIVNHMCDNQRLYIQKVWLFDMQYPNMEAYVESNNMQQNGWGSQLELFALAHILQRMVYTYTPHGGYHWACHCPRRWIPTSLPL